MVAWAQWQRMSCPLPSYRPARAEVATRTRVQDSHAPPSQVSAPWRARRGQARREEMTMTRNKAQKIAARQRMAETGEPYSVARRETPPPGSVTPEERYAREARDAGVPEAEIAAQLAAFRMQEARELADAAEEAAELGREATHLGQRRHLSASLYSGPVPHLPSLPPIDALPPLPPRPPQPRW